jgi:FAD/FMN-containing dehydrogenase
MAVKAGTELKKKLSEITGPDRLSDSKEDLEDYNKCLAPGFEGKAVAVARPKDKDEVQAIVQLANEMDLNLVVASSGGPRFRGDTVPLQEGVIMDLSSLNKVLRVDNRNKVAIIEPGVTFGVLKQAAEGAGLKVLMPLLQRSSKSVIASYLEREPTLIPKYHWDVTDPLMSTQVVFGTGDLFHTGSAAGPGSLEEQWATGGSQKNPMGPGQTDFLRLVQGSQGTMGVVTWAALKLELLPTARKIYFVREEKLEKLVDFSYRMNRLKLADELLILNDFALAAIIGKTAGEIESLARQQATFTLIYCLAGYEYYPEERVSYLEKDVAEIAQQYGVRISHEVPGVSSAAMLDLLDNPSPDPYWKLRFRGSFREIIFLTTMDKTPVFIDLMRKTAEQFKYPVERIAIYIQPIQQGRSSHLEFDLFYNREEDNERKQMDAMFAKASEELLEAGAFFSRPYGAWAKPVYAACPDSVQALMKVKGLLDPHGVLNRGKLCFEEV